MRQTGYRQQPISPSLPAMRFHGFKPRHIKRQLGKLYTELAQAREPLAQGFSLDLESYDNILKMFLIRDASLPAFNTMPLPDYVDAFHGSGMSTLLTMIEPMIVFMAAVHEPMDQLSIQMRRWGAFEDSFAMEDGERRISSRLWVRTRKLLKSNVSPGDMPRRFVSYYVANAEQIEDRIKLTGADLIEIEAHEALYMQHGLDPVVYFPATMQLLRRTMREHAFDSHDSVRAVAQITLNHADKPPTILATHEGMQAMTIALETIMRNTPQDESVPLKPKFVPTADKRGKPFTLN